MSVHRCLLGFLTVAAATLLHMRKFSQIVSEPAHTPQQGQTPRTYCLARWRDRKWLARGLHHGPVLRRVVVIDVVEVINVSLIGMGCHMRRRVGQGAMDRFQSSPAHQCSGSAGNVPHTETIFTATHQVAGPHMDRQQGHNGGPQVNPDVLPRVQNSHMGSSAPVLIAHSSPSRC